MNRTNAITLILRHLEGTATAADEQALRAWLAEDPEHHALRDQLVQLHGADWRAVEPAPSKAFLAAQLKTLRQRATVQQDLERSRQLRIRIAAVMLLVVMASLFVYITLPANSSATVQFSQTELHEVVQTLEDTYRISVSVDQPGTGRLRFTGLFVNANETDVLAALQASLPVTVERHNHRYILKSRNGL